MVRAIVLNADDNVVTLIDSGVIDESVELTGKRSGALTLTADVAFGHKAALRNIAGGEPILKYGKVIGRATVPIKQGEHVHTHNVEALRARGDMEE